MYCTQSIFRTSVGLLFWNTLKLTEIKYEIMIKDNLIVSNFIEFIE